MANDDWTSKQGWSNSSDKYCEMVDAVDHLIRESAFSLISGRTDIVARLIVSQLAHVHGMRPANG